MPNRHVSRVVFLLVVLALLPAVAYSQFGNLKIAIPKSSEKKTLTIGDIDPALVKVPIAFEGVMYEQIGEQPFDDFFKSAAKLNGLSQFSVAMCDDATTQLKKYARSKYADAELKASIDELTNNTPPENWTTEQAFAVERLAKEKKKVSADETKFFVGTGGSMVVMGASLAKGAQSVGDLLKQGSGLLGKVTSLPGSKVLAATSATKTCVTNLDNFQSNVPSLIKQVNSLATSFQSL